MVYLTNDEIIRAWNCCKDVDADCRHCPLADKDITFCTDELKKITTARIKEQEAQIAQLKNK